MCLEFCKKYYIKFEKIVSRKVSKIY